MDTIAALNFGIVISMAIKSRGVKEESDVIKTSIKAGIGAGSLLIIVYSMLCYLGASCNGTFGATENGAQTLTNVGLTKILAISVPVLNAIYPIAIMLIALAILESFFNVTKFSIRNNYFVYSCS